MTMFNALATSATALRINRLRLTLISENMANAYTTRTPEGGPYRAKKIITRTIPAYNSFEDALRASTASRPPMRVPYVQGIYRDNSPPILKYDPSHPDADANGYVAMPNINTVEEMGRLISTVHSYEANVTVTQATKDLFKKALEI
ncbi:MAG: flagellar basal body rod protein FlgC [bacterium]